MNNFASNTTMPPEQDTAAAAKTGAGQAQTQQGSAQRPIGSQPMWYPVPPAPQPKGRRVGTVTMACSLIAVGVLLVIGTFNQSISFLLLTRLAPIILIVLGIEILFRYFVSKGEKLRYDFLSGFICFLLIVGSLGMAAIPEIWNNWGPHRHILEESLRAQANQICSQALKEEQKVTGMSIEVYLQRSDLPETMTVSDIRPADYIEADLKMANTFASEEEFAQAAQPVLAKLAGTGIPFDQIYLQTPSVEQRYGYSLYLDDGLGFNLSLEQLMDNISVHYNSEEDAPEEYEQVQKFAETYFAEFAAFLQQYAQAVPAEYPARCRAFASHFAEQFDQFVNGESVVFPQEASPAPSPEQADPGQATEEA